MTDIVTFNVVRALDLNGVSVPGAQAWFYNSGTDTERTVYTDQAGTIPHAQPVTADGEGVFPAVYDSASGAVRVIVKDASGVTLDGYPMDPAPKVPAVANAASSITFTPTDDIQADDVQEAIELVQSQATASAGTATTDANTYTDTQVDSVKSWVNGGEFGGSSDNLYIGVVVAVMSSTGAGVGSTGNTEPSAENEWSSGPNSCVNLLKTAIGTRGTLINRSVAGANTATQRDRFFDRVARYHPRHVILGTGLSNETGNTGAERAGRYMRALMQQIAMVRQIGANPIVWAFNPFETLDASGRSTMRGIKRMCARLGVRVWDMSAGTRDDDYAYLPGLNYDDLHGNDAAHSLFFDATYLSDFRAVGPLPVLAEPARYRIGLTAGDVTPALYATTMRDEDNAASWSIFARVYKPSSVTSGSQRILSAYLADSMPGLRLIRGTSGNYVLASTSGIEIATTVSASKAGTDDILIRYHRWNQTLAIYINGTFAGDVSGVVLNAMYGFGFGSYVLDASYPAIDYQLEDLRVWRVPFVSPEVSLIFDGDRPCEGLMFDLSTQDYTPGVIINRANSPGLRTRMGPTGQWIQV